MGVIIVCVCGGGMSVPLEVLYEELQTDRVSLYCEMSSSSEHVLCSGAAVL